MSLSTPDARGRAYVKDGAVDWLLGRLTDYAFAAEQPPVTAPAEALDDTVGAGQANVGDPNAGTVSLTLDPMDFAGHGVRVIKRAFRDKDDVKVQFWLGGHKLIGSQAAGANGTTVAVAKATNLLTVKQKGTGSEDIPANFGTSDISPGPFWARGQILELGGNAYHVDEWLSATTRRVSLLGPVTGGLATEATAAQQAADWSAAASDTFKVHKYAMRFHAEGRVLVGGDLSASTGAAPVTITIRLNDFASETYALKATL